MHQTDSSQHSSALQNCSYPHYSDYSVAAEASNKIRTSLTRALSVSQEQTGSCSSPCQPMKMLWQIVASKSSCSVAEKHGPSDQTSAVHLITHLHPFALFGYSWLALRGMAAQNDHWPYSSDLTLLNSSIQIRCILATGFRTSDGTVFKTAGHIGVQLVNN